MQAAARHESWLRRQGLAPVSSELSEATRVHGFVYLCCGRRGGGSRESRLDHDVVEQFLDPKDRGIGEEPKERKEVRSWMPYPLDVSKWRGSGVPASVERLMTEGAQIEQLAEGALGELLVLEGERKDEDAQHFRRGGGLPLDE